MVAASLKTMQVDDIMLWIYHLPDLQVFIQRVMQFQAIFPYNTCDLGLAVNIARPLEPGVNSEVSLGFHFDAINSSPYGKDSSQTFQARGATGLLLPFSPLAFFTLCDVSNLILNSLKT